jgi:triosephosphate isomerase
MPKKPIFVGNWKMNFLEEDVVSFFREFSIRQIAAYIGFAVPAPYLKLASSLIANTGIKIGAENCHWETSGAYTGEISPQMIKDCGASFTLVGHSERRQYFGETDESVRKRTINALSNNLLTITCIGETKEEYQSGKRTEVLSRQLSLGLEGITDNLLDNLIIAYEPVWAIGTGLSATPEEAESAHNHIRGELSKLFPERGDSIPILYGGSVNSKNSKELLNIESIDGVLVGGSSLKAGEFGSLIEACL